MKYSLSVHNLRGFAWSQKRDETRTIRWIIYYNSVGYSR